jgi:metal-responsive CopG/Arc/MetJ family transcriptional regulator
MINISLPDDLAHRLEEIARQQNRSVADVLATWLDEHKDEEERPKGIPNWDLILGVYDDDVTDMSTTVRETLQEYFKKKYGDPD